MGSEQTRAGVTLERPLCIEEGCDRTPPAGERRCLLHSNRLGRIPAPPVPLAPATEQQAATAGEPPASTPPSSRFWWHNMVACGACVLLFWSGPLVVFGSSAGPKRAHHLLALLLLGLGAAGAGPFLGWAAIKRANTSARAALSWSAFLVASVPVCLIGLAVLVILFRL
jgi:hypothetical protein